MYSSILFVRDILFHVIVSNHSDTDRENNILDVRWLTHNEAEREIKRTLEESFLRNGK